MRLFIVLVLFHCHLLSATPYSPFNRNKAIQDNYHPTGISYATPVQFGAIRDPPPSPQQSKFDVVYEWQTMDFEYPSSEARRRALANG